jgi:hypothetical protein
MLPLMCLIAAVSALIAINELQLTQLVLRDLQTVRVVEHGRQATTNPMVQAQAGPLVTDGPEPQPPPLPLVRPVVRVADGPEPQPPPLPLAV